MKRIIIKLKKNKNNDTYTVRFLILELILCKSLENCITVACS